jgi:hypothetical protein
MNEAEINVPTVVSKGIGIMNVPMGQGLPKGPPDQRQRPGCQRKIAAHLEGSPPLEGKHCPAGLENYKED